MDDGWPKRDYSREFAHELVQDILAKPFDVERYRAFLTKHRDMVSDEVYQLAVKDENFLRNRYNTFFDLAIESSMPYWGELVPLLEQPFHAYRFRKFMRKHKKMIYSKKEYEDFERRDDAFAELVFNKLRAGLKELLLTAAKHKGLEFLIGTNNTSRNL